MSLTKIMTHEMPPLLVHPVPLYRQRFAPERWEEDGFASVDESLYWSDRSCGIACVRMAISYFHGEAPVMSELLKTGLALSAYTTKGWLHSGLADILRTH